MNDFQHYLKRIGYSEVQPGIWQKEISEGVPKCARSGKKPIVTLKEVDDAVELSLSGFSRFGLWCEINAGTIDQSQYSKKYGEMELRLADAWRAFN